MKPTLSVSMDQSSNLDAISNDRRIPNHASSGESMPMCICEHISSVVGAELTSSGLFRAEGSDQKEGKVGLAKSALIPDCANGIAPDQHLPESLQTKHEAERAQNGQRKHKHKKEVNLPRRASKRLAGIKLDPVPELKTSDRVRRVAVKEASEGEVNANVDNSPNFLPSGASKQFGAVEGGSDTNCKFGSATTNTMESCKCEFPEKSLEEHGSDKDKECYSFLPLDNQGNAHEHVRIPDAKFDYSLDLPLGELLTDPCIAFAIQTLTGETFESYKNNQSSSELKNFKHDESSAAAEGHNEKIEFRNMGDEKEGCNVFSTPENLSILREHAADTKIGGEANVNSGSSSEMPIDISWMDPCIEFAIKTLTGSGAIPLDTDPNSENCLQRQLSSSNTQGHCEMAQ